IPPISSTIRSLPARISSKSPRERVSTPETSGLSPVVAATAAARSSSRVSKADPTVPWPSRPTLNDVSAMQLLVGLAAHDGARGAVLAEDHRRPGLAVVGVGHRVAVGARGGGDDHVAGPRVGQPRIADEHVPRLAVLADDRAGHAALLHAGGDVPFITSAVEHRAKVVAHPTVDRDEQLPGA